MNEDFLKGIIVLLGFIACELMIGFFLSIMLHENILNILKKKDKEEEPTNKRVSYVDSYRRCPSCNRIHDGGSKCSNCGHYMSW